MKQILVKPEKQSRFRLETNDYICTLKDRTLIFFTSAKVIGL